MKVTGDLVVGVLSVAFGGFIVHLGRAFSAPNPANDSGLLPRSVGAALVLCGVILIVKWVASQVLRRGGSDSAAVGGPADETVVSSAGVVAETLPQVAGQKVRAVSDLALPIVALLLSAGFAWAALTQNFLAYTVAFVIGASWVLERKRRTVRTLLTNVVIGVAVVAAVYFVFTIAFGVRL